MVVDKLRNSQTLGLYVQRILTRTKMHWLTKTKAGIALGFAALLGLLVGRW